jgi:hypothetical protein
MKVRILRFEQTQDSSGNPEIFMMVEANTGTGLYHRAEWLTSEEVAAITADISQKTIIAEEMADRAVLAKTQELAELAAMNNVNPN